MSISQAAARVYAGALFDIGAKAGAVSRVSDELHAVQAALNGLDPQLRVFFDMPQLRRDDKRRMINLAFEAQVGRPVLGLLNVLVDKRREQLLDTIISEFDHLVDEHEGRVRASVTSAVRLDADLAATLLAALEQRTNQRVVLRQRIDPDVLGGIRVSLGDLVLDGTLRRGLSDMRRALTATQG